LITPAKESFTNINYVEDLQESQEESQEESYSFLVKRKPVAFQRNRISTIPDPEVVNELFSDGNSDDTSEDDNEREFEDNTSEYSSDGSSEAYQVNFDAPEIEIEQNYPVWSEELNENFSWIVIWILKYQERYKLSNTATDSLLKFFRYVLMGINKNLFSNFPTSLYMALKKFGICTHLIKYAACKKYCKLYQVADVSSSSTTLEPKFAKCVFQDFPNHPMSNKRNFCGNTLYKQVHTKNGIIKKPDLIFPTVSLKHQLSLLFK
jgi:hypothetical protein